MIKAELHALSEVAQKAMEYENAGDDESAITEWEKIFSVQDERSKSGSSGPTIISSPSKPWSSYENRC